MSPAKFGGGGARFCEPLAEERGFAIALDVEPGVMVRGDRNLLSQAIANLLDNVLKYGVSAYGMSTGSASEIRLSVRGDHGTGVLEVSDRGPGIPAGSRETVLDRFVRLEPSRSTPGNGLGLSLVRAVARLHNGTVELSDNAPGLKVRLEFPTCAG